MRIDVHQHIWTEPLLDALASRACLPFIRREGGLTVLYCADERPYVIDVESEAPQPRAQLVRSDGIDLALIAPSSPIGMEVLGRADAVELISAHLDGVTSLGSEFAAWGPIPLEEPDPDDVDQVLARGCVGVSLPAAALVGAESLDALGVLLARVAERGVPLLVHPGRARAQPPDAGSLTEPLWWRALTDYVSQTQAAWLTFTARGRREHPELTVVFALLAGGAPLLSERLVTRGGPATDLSDPLVFYDSSSYGPAAVEAMVQRVGLDQLVYGSDRPVVEPIATGRDDLLQTNAARLVEPTRAAA